MPTDPRLRVLVVEDDPNLGLVLCDNLDEAGLRTDRAATLQAARQALSQSRIDLVVLDLMLPDGDGLDLARELRRAGSRVPILMLTARTAEADLLSGFAAGADDYVSKPYRLRELLARVTALLRRATARVGEPDHQLDATAPVLAFPGFRFDVVAHRLVDEQARAIELTSKEYNILRLFVNNRDRALTRQEILAEVWGEDIAVDLRTIDNFVSSLKRKLGWTPASAFRIHTIRGVGYRMEWDDDA